jgi:hypothetical protein
MPRVDELPFQKHISKLFPDDGPRASWLPRKGANSHAAIDKYTHFSAAGSCQLFRRNGQRRKVAGRQRASERRLFREKTREKSRDEFEHPVRVSVLSSPTSIILREAKSNPHFRGSKTRGLVTHTYNYAVFCVSI